MHIQCISWTNILHTKVEEQPVTQLLLNESYSNPASNVEREWAVTERMATPAS